MKPSPPHRALRFLRWFCREDYIEEIEGDLTEVFEKQYEQSQAKARRKFTWSVIRYFRPGFIKSFNTSYSTNTIAMFRHNFLLTFRNFKRYKGSFFINLIGLSTGLACALLIYLWVNDEVHMDKFLKNDERLYQVKQNIPTADGPLTTDGTPGLLARTLIDEMPEIEYASSAITSSWFDAQNGVISIGDTHFKAKAQMVEEDYFNIFSWNIIHRGKDRLLPDKYAVLISDELATRLFQRTENIIGKTITWKHEDFEGEFHITGVFEKPPANSSTQFDLLFNYEFMLEKDADNLEHWGNSGPCTYLLVKAGTNIEALNDKIRDFRKTKYKALVGTKYLEHIGTLFLQRYSDQYLYDHYENGVQSGGRIMYVKLFSIIAVFLLIIGAINFMNLSTARASRRMSEIGIKKTVGASRKALMFQFLGESMLMTLLSSMVAILIVALLLPEFNAITGKQIELSFSKEVISSILAITLITGLFSGSYPALFLSRLRPISTLKGKMDFSTGEPWIRKGLVVFQFVISLILIVSVLVVYQQIEFIQTKNLGYNKDNIMSFVREGQQDTGAEAFMNELKNIPGVVQASTFGHDLVGDYGGTGAVVWEGKKPDQRINFGNLEMDYDLIEMLEIEMVAGRSFSKELGSNRTQIIFNEAAIAAMGLEDPIGKTIKLWGQEREIIGVAKNFHFESFYEKVKPCFIQCYPDLQNILVKIKAGMEKETLTRIEDFYQKHNKELPFDYRFLDEDYQALYAAEQRVSALSKYFAGIAILVSCLGLFGLVAFTAERRLKEIGIRKVLGSSELGIIKLLSGDFTRMVLVAIAIALPLSYLVTREWLKNFAYRIDLAWWFFISAGIMVLLIAWVTVGIQTIKVARISPTECLKDE
ncbi:ABC transporter permease [Fulvivirgaceae bacterium BMA10]|uniref:ABC transporter permease n=1 Tax=Splendidivirga corallicola TaxID=3051826 RepID=A0ABT8KJW1_9BACT|nr:ABC transporter permease [Fulvivirgaceae bacterium BMA10]